MGRFYRVVIPLKYHLDRSAPFYYIPLDHPSQSVVGIGIKVFAQLREGGYVPFGPFLALAGLTSLFFGPRAILAAIGL